MSQSPDFDLETLRQSRIARLEAELHELAGRLTHLHWPSTQAEVTDCKRMRVPQRFYGDSYPLPEPPLIRGYAVGFRYSVDGKSYTGILDSPVEVEAGDRFQLRYNPNHPNENNSLCSENSPSMMYAKLANVVLAILAVAFLLAFLKDHVLKLLRH